MQYKAIVNGESSETLDVAFERTASGIEASVGRRKYSLDVSAVIPGVYLLGLGTLSIEVAVLPEGNITSASTVSIGGRRISVEILDERKALQRMVRNSERSGASEIRSPMPGKIVRVLLTEGAEVAAGQGIVVMEAMKMQNEMKSSMSGRIRRIEVVEGETVGSGALIAIVESV
jgi:biotin carboxyl carrier protein